MAARSLGYSFLYTLASYAIVGDDIIIFDHKLAKAYYDLVVSYGMSISLNKSLTPNQNPLTMNYYSEGYGYTVRNKSFRQDSLSEFLSK